ncbi:MAG: aldehyde dehydrogenase [Gammaproteobacteria bacterium]
MSRGDVVEIDPNISASRSLLIGGSWHRGGGAPLASTDPATGETNAILSTGSAEDVDLAVNAARDALGRAGWADLLPHRRADHLHAIARLLNERVEPLAQIVMHENGKTLTECHQQIRGAAGIFRYYAALCETVGSDVTPSRGDYLSLTVHEPIGVVAAITPWNSPVNLAADKLAPALAAGNAVLLKPSELTSIVSLELGKLCIDAGLPAGLVNVLPGTAKTASALVRHPGVNMISFTGGTTAGRAIATVAAERIVPVLLELGGKSPNIVMDDADLSLAAAGVAAGIFGSLGQSCIAGSRLFVHESIREQLVSMLVDIARGLRLGPPDAATTQLGPLASFPHRERVHGLVSAARGEGGRILAGGSAPEGALFSKGAYYLPTIIDGLDNASATCQSEIFGPVLCVLPFTDEADLVRQANGTVYGLACGVWSRDFAKAWRVARRVHAGTVWINTYRQNSVSTPFGGVKQSGIGRERGVNGLRQYQQIKSVFVATSDAPLNFDR